jgi:hypothetical protein
MSKFKVLALAATLVMATAGLAIAGGDCASKASAETASASGCSSAATAETAAAKTASAEGCASGAAAQTASAEGCASGAAAKTASAEGCASGAAAKTASAEGCASGVAAQTASAEGCASGAAAQTAGAGCSSDANVSAQTVQLETVRMPSGSMAVFYNGTNAETVAYLQSKANEGCSGFVCDMAKGMAADDNVTTEIAATEHGVMILVTAKSDAASVDKYEEQYAAVVASMDDDQGE